MKTASAHVSTTSAWKILSLASLLALLASPALLTAAEPSGEVTLDVVRDAMADIPPDFKPEPEKGDVLVACEIHRRRARSLADKLALLATKSLEPAAKAELEEITKEFKRRYRPICLNYLRAVIDGMPVEFRDLGREKVEELKNLVATSIVEAEYYLATYPPAEETPEVQFFLAKLRFLSSSVWLQGRIDAWKQAHGGERPPVQDQVAWKEEYFERIFELLNAVDASGKLPEKYKASAAKLRADSLVSLGKREAAADLARSIDAARSFLACSAASVALSFAASTIRLACS